MHKQITDYINNYIFPYLFDIEKDSVRNKLYCHALSRFEGAVLMNLSKTFDTVKHNLLIDKLYA